MRTRSSSNLVGESSPNPTSSYPKRHNLRSSKQPFILEESPVDTMADQRTMAELLREPSSLFDFEEVMNNNHNKEPPPQNDPPPMVRLNGEAPRMMEELLIRDETPRNISSTSSTESPEVVRQLEMMNTNFSEMMRQFQTIKAIDTKCETCGGPHSFIECPVVGGYTQETAYATTSNYNSG
nr:hypothetical protein [Tanacetum cinerariifolium]